MSIAYKASLLTAARATHFARLMLLLDGSLNYWHGSAHYGVPDTMLYFFFFLIDIIPFLMFWFFIPELEEGARALGIFWIVLLIIVLLPAGMTTAFFIVCCIQLVILVWPRRYMTSTDYEVEGGNAIHERIKCVHCGMTYAYTPDSIVNGEAICQNCGKSFKT